MASTGGVTLDKVVIQIESSADRANSNLKGLSKTLVELRNSLKGGFHNLEKLAESLEKLNKSSSGMKNVAKNLQSLSTVTDSLKGLSEISSPTGLKKTIDNLEKLPTTFEKMTPDTIANVARVSEELARALTPLANKMADIGNGFSKLQMLADRYGVSVTKVRENNKSATSGMNQMKSVLNGVANGFKKAISFASNFLTIGKRTFSALEKPLSKTTKKIRQMGMALLSVRSIFTFTRKAIDEYTQMDSVLQESIQNTWRAMGAQLAPVVEFMINLFHQFVRVVYSVIMALTGIDLIARANDKAMKSWSKSAKDALGNLQKFDDLNVVEFPKAAGDENKLIEMDSIDLSPIQKIMDWVTEMKNSIKEALDTGKWSNVGVVFGTGINSALDLFVTKLPIVQEKLNNVASNFGEFINGAVSEINWENVGKSLFSFGIMIRNTLTTAIATVNWQQIGDAIETTLQNIRFEDIINSWVNLIKAAFSGINDILLNIDFKALGEKLRTAIQNIDWKALWSTIIEAAKTALTSLGDFLQGLFDIDGTDILKTIGLIGALAGVFLILKKVIGGFKSSEKTINETTKSFGKMFEGFGKAAGTIALLGGIALVIHEIVDLIKVFGESGMSATDGLILLGGALGALAISFAAIAASTKLIDWKGIAGGVVILGGLALVIHELSGLLGIFNDTGLTVGEGLGFLGGVLGIVVLAMTAMAAIAKVLASDPLVLLGVLALVAAISATLLVLKETLPTILDACGNFIEKIAPYIIQLIGEILDGVKDIIYSLGDVLPPIINSVGDVFTKIFGGIALVVNAVGDTIVNIMNTAASLVDRVLKSILNFINQLGPAINNFVDNVIRAITKLINFVVSAVEYLINTAIIKPINKLINKINNNAIAEALGWEIGTLGLVSIDRFVPKLETGTNEVPYEGVYHLHPGEAVVPKKYNPALGNGGNEETNQKLDRLISIMDNMSFTNVVNIGNKTLYKEQQKYNKSQNNKYGTLNT